jgi:hypothetical protein
MSLITTEQSVYNFLLSYVGVRSLSCQRIRGRTNSSPSFLSFKIGLNYNDFIRVLQQNEWPPGMIVREFVEQPDNYAVLPSVVVPQQQRLQFPASQQSAQLQCFYPR